MSRRAAKVTQADIARAIRAAEQAPTPRVVEIAPDGTIRIVPIDGATEGTRVAEEPDAVIW